MYAFLQSNMMCLYFFLKKNTYFFTANPGCGHHGEKEIRGQGKTKTTLQKRKYLRENFCVNLQVAIVTGGAGGIGSAVVARFLNDGASVAIVDLNTDAANKLLNNEFKE